MKWIPRLFSYTKALERHCDHQATVIEKQFTRIIEFEDGVYEIRALLPEGKRPGKRMDEIDTLHAFSDAVVDISALMAACIDYRRLLIRANVPDAVSGQHGGVEAILDKYKIPMEARVRGYDEQRAREYLTTRGWENSKIDEFLAGQRSARDND